MQYLDTFCFFKIVLINLKMLINSVNRFLNIAKQGPEIFIVDFLLIAHGFKVCFPTLSIHEASVALKFYFFFINLLQDRFEIVVEIAYAAKSLS